MKSWRCFDLRRRRDLLLRGKRRALRSDKARLRRLIVKSSAFPGCRAMSTIVEDRRSLRSERPRDDLKKLSRDEVGWRWSNYVRKGGDLKKIGQVKIRFYVRQKEKVKNFHLTLNSPTKL